MANYGGFYKGDKKKQKKEKLGDVAKRVESTNQPWGSPTFTLPEILPKGKDKNA